MTLQEIMEATIDGLIQEHSTEEIIEATIDALLKITNLQEIQHETLKAIRKKQSDKNTFLLIGSLVYLIKKREKPTFALAFDQAAEMRGITAKTAKRHKEKFREFMKKHLEKLKNDPNCFQAKNMDIEGFINGYLQMLERHHGTSNKLENLSSGECDDVFWNYIRGLCGLSIRRLSYYDKIFDD